VAADSRARKAIMTIKYAQPKIITTPRCDQGSSDLDPAEFCATLRELALRVHRIVLAAHGLSFGADDSEEELAEVRARIGRLQSNPGVARRDEVLRYLSALRKRVEELLAGAIGIERVMSGGFTERGARLAPVLNE
jgi:hypothetical protein